MGTSVSPWLQDKVIGRAIAMGGAASGEHGRAVQVEPIKPVFTAPGSIP
jgi:hypothetical protein